MRPIQTSKAFGNEVRRARNAQGLSQARLAEKALVSRQWLSGLENGKRTAELGRALSVVSALGMAVTIAPIAEVDPSQIDLGQLLGEETPGDNALPRSRRPS